MAEENGTVFGIDLGTTYSCVAYIDETGNPVVASNLDGERTTPSVVNFSDSETNIVGQVAKDNAVVEPDRTVQFVKTLMGNSRVAITIDGVDKTPEEVSSYILRKVSEDAAATTGFKVENVVITVPAYFGDAERKATKAAGEMAGLNVLKIVQEPVAAAVYYGCAKGDKDQTVLVYDLGGGTFDVTVINISNGGTEIRVVCSDGNHNLGGRLWDQAIVQYLADAFREETDYDDDYDEFAMQIFQSAAEKAKKQLTQREEVKVPLNIAGLPSQLKISRETFEQLTSHLLDETVSLTKKVVDNATSKDYTIEKILLVGGSTFMPQVAKSLDVNFPDLPHEINDPNEAVAKGAALTALSEAVHIINGEAGDHAGNTQGAGGADKPVISLPGTIDVETVANTTFILATTKSYGVEVVSDGEAKINNLIMKNQEMPREGAFTHKETYGTMADNQRTVTVSIYENDEEEVLIDIAGRTPIMSADFDLGGSLPKNSPIDVTFSLDQEGILDVLAVEPKGGLQFPMRIETKSLTAEEIEEIKASALAMNVE